MNAAARKGSGIFHDVLCKFSALRDVIPKCIILSVQTKRKTDCELKTERLALSIVAR